MNANHSLSAVPNLLRHEFSAARTNQKRVADITYIPIEEGWLYLAVFMDHYSRRMMG